MRNQVVVVVVVLLSITWISMIASAAVTVNNVALTMDRPTFYVNNSLATASVVLDYNGNKNELDNVSFTWLRPDMSVAVVQLDSAVSDANASSSYIVDMIGVWHVNATYVNQPEQYDNVSFEVRSADDVVVISNLLLELNAPYFEISEVVTATATLDYAGNVSLFESVNYTWVDPFGAVLRQTAVLPNSTGVASDSWQSDSEGNPFRVYTNYTGDAPVSGFLDFMVFPLRVKTWHNFSVVVDEIWDTDGEPYGICNNITVEAGVTLTIEAGVTMRFCEDKGMTVEGTLISEGSLDSPVNFTGFGFFPTKGYWNGVALNASSGSTSSVTYSRLSFASIGLLIVSASPTVERNSFDNMSIAAIQYENSTASMEFNAFDDVGKGVSASASSIDLRFNTLSNTMIGVALMNSNATLHGDTILNSTSFGIHAFNSTVSASNINISLSGGSALRLQSQSQAKIGSSVMENSWYGVDAFSSVFEMNESTLRTNDNAVRANDAQGDMTNSSVIDSTDLDFLLEGGSTVVALNSSFNESKIQVQPASRLIVQQFLHVHVSHEDGGSPIGNAFVEVLDGGSSIFSARTSSSGRIRWIPVTDRTFDGTNVATKHTIVVKISKSGYEITDAERTVDMSVSRLEVFLGTEVIQDVWGQVSDPFFLILLLIVISVLAAAFIIARRRLGREEEEEPAPRTRKPEDYVLRKGASYLVSGEKPDLAFGIFTNTLAVGASGLCITRGFPDEVSEQYELGSTPIIWLSRDTKRTSINPTNLGAIILEVQRFMEGAGDDDTVVMLDGLEYLIVQNDFSKVVKFVQNLKDTISVGGSKLVIPFNLAALEESRQALLLRDLELLE